MAYLVNQVQEGIIQRVDVIEDGLLYAKGGRIFVPN